MTLTTERLKQVILDDKRHKGYMETVKESDHVAFHLEGFSYDWYGEKSNDKDYNFLDNLNNLNYEGNLWFDIIVAQYRPDENKNSEALDYRIKSYRPITKGTINAAVTEFQKITRSSDWNIKYSGETPPNVPEDMDLENYLENYPIWGTFTNFIQTVLTKEICLDANQLCTIIPDNLPDTQQELDLMDDSELMNPVVKFFKSRYVLDYIENDYAITYEPTEDIYWAFTKERLTKYKISSNDNVNTLTIILDMPYAVELEQLNAKKLKGIFKKTDGKNILYESFVAPMMPSLDKAARESSDLDASTVRAMFPQAWQFEGMSCSQCSGTGKLTGISNIQGGVPNYGKPTTCPSCGGLGSVTHSPSQTLIVKNASIGEQQIPTPPKGFVEPTTAIIELQQKSIREHQYNSLAAINLQFLDKTPVVESGVAKEVDRDSLNNTLYMVAQNIVMNATYISKLTNDLRYMVLVPSQQERDLMLPTITVPEDYSIITSKVYLEEYDKAKKAMVSNSTQRELELNYLSKKYEDNKSEKERTMNYVALNPAYGMSGEDISNARLVGTLTEEDAVISTYIIDFVDRAFSENENFNELDRSARLEILQEYAEEKLNEGGSSTTGEPPSDTE